MAGDIEQAAYMTPAAANLAGHTQFAKSFTRISATKGVCKALEYNELCPMLGSPRISDAFGTRFAS
jgi:hypothetical protein